MSYPETSPTLENLSGTALANGWVVGEIIARKTVQTGGCFSVAYRAHRGSENAFLKVLDLSRAFEAADPMRELENVTRSFNFERDLLEACSEKSLSRVVKALDSGVIHHANAHFKKLYYLLFELADSDVRVQLSETRRLELSWCMQSLHHIATALNQLHGIGVFHQDVKPSNVLVFDEGTVSKIADLGRAHWAAVEAPHDVLELAGARQYAPPELLYGAPPADARMRRASCDLYLFGSMIHFFVTGVPITPVIIDALPDIQKPRMVNAFDGKPDIGWRGSYQELLPFLTSAHAHSIDEFDKALVKFAPQGKESACHELSRLLAYATDPDPKRRGHPTARRQTHGNPYDMQQFISIFNRLSIVFRRSIDA